MTSRKKSLSFNIAFCGIICALATAIMFASIIPAMTYALPAVAGILIWTISEQINRKWALLSYLAVVALAFLLVPEMEAKIYFTLFFGYYPTVRSLFERIKPKPLSFVLKLVLFNASVVIAFFIASAVLGLDKVLAGMEDFGTYAVYVLWGMGNIAFLAYEFCLGYVMFAYIKWLKPRFSKRIK